MAAGTESVKEAAARGTNKAFGRYCQYQNDTAFEMAGLLKKKLMQRYWTSLKKPETACISGY